jgi:hypothetical protein
MTRVVTSGADHAATPPLLGDQARPPLGSVQFEWWGLAGKREAPPHSADGAPPPYGLMLGKPRPHYRKCWGVPVVGRIPQLR